MQIQKIACPTVITESSNTHLSDETKLEVQNERDMIIKSPSFPIIIGARARNVQIFPTGHDNGDLILTCTYPNDISKHFQVTWKSELEMVYSLVLYNNLNPKLKVSKKKRFCLVQ